jgi:hypothetical protein
MQDLSALQVNELVPLDHGDDRMIDCLGVLVPLHHFLVKLRVRDLGANSHTALNSLLNFANHGHELYGSLNALCSHSTLSCVKCRDLEDSMCLFHVLDLDLSL